MYVIGITGGIGSGKSTVAARVAARGVPVLDADAISHEVTAAGGRAMEEIAAAFGKRAVRSDGALDRRGMAQLVFKERPALDRLSAIVHRHVLAVMGERLAAMKEKGAKAVALDVPIPVKTGFLDLCDAVWVVHASEAARISRLAARGMKEDEARRRIAVQIPEEEYLALADEVLENEGDLDALTRRVDALLEEALGERGIRLKD
jgi:dephospho-CoA kinase